MGKRSKKLKASSDDGTRRIGDIFLARPKTKMDEDPLDSPDAIPEADDPFNTVQLGNLRGSRNEGRHPGPSETPAHMVPHGYGAAP
ncbi:Hypothetical predicted protein [Pelobates cultripes]|uniref:Uncharacterized protein n=1 Tax=Pelobates cultripes TaxID=61616 RepID=A0AAD1W1A4_PELCU|nr:Hypothetical predicted protein [Pelobates cultripes]